MEGRSTPHRHGEGDDRVGPRVKVLRLQRQRSKRPRRARVVEKPRRDGGGSAGEGDGPKRGDEENSGEGRRRGPPRLLLVAIALAVLGAGGWYGWRWWSHARLHESTDNAYVQGPVAQVGARIAGTVLRVHVADNAAVEAGAPLFDLDPRDLEATRAASAAGVGAAEAKVAQARAQGEVAAAAVGEAEAQLLVAEAEAGRAATELARYGRLSAAAVAATDRDRVGAESRSSAARVEAARRRLASARAGRAEAEAGLRGAEAELGQAAARLREADLNLSHTRVVAPFAGRVANKRVEPGDGVRPGQPVLALVGVERWLEANFKETQLTDMRPGQSVIVTVDAFPDRRMQGTVESIGRGTGSRFAALPAQNATGNWVKVVQRVPVRVTLDEEWSRRVGAGEVPIAPGMSSSVEVRVRDE